jgi:hypothetical protein
MKRAEPKVRKSVTRYGRWFLVVASLALLVGCGEDGATVPRGPGGTGASGGVGATGGNGTGGMGGMVGTGGMGSMVGTGGTGGSAAGGGTGGELGPCVTNALCHTCPDRFLCQTDENCTFSGDVCVDSGCDTLQGAAIRQCQPSQGGSCVDVGDCPNASDYDCMIVGAGGERCVRVTAGCDPVTESYDCVPGFSCEGGTCVDRRVPCDSYLDCPKSHVCKIGPTSDFCLHVYRTCYQDADCFGGAVCADVDGDGRKECAGSPAPSEVPPVACVNSTCTSDEVCELSVVANQATCGDYGLCLSNSDCDVASGFECVGLWQDGRKECVRAGGICDQVTQCPLQQVCASPRNGGAPSCQAGSVP